MLQSIDEIGKTAPGVELRMNIQLYLPRDLSDWLSAYVAGMPYGSQQGAIRLALVDYLRKVAPELEP